MKKYSSKAMLRHQKGKSLQQVAAIKNRYGVCDKQTTIAVFLMFKK